MKVICRLLIAILVCLIIYTTPCYATLSYSEIKSGVDTFESKGKASGEELIKGEDVAPLANGVANILVSIGVIIIFAGLLVVGIKYMTASPEESARAKVQFVGLLVSGVVIVGAFGIWKLVGTFLTNLAD